MAQVARRNEHAASGTLTVPRPRAPRHPPLRGLAPQSPHEGTSVAKPIVLIAEQLSPATVEALGTDFDIREVDGTDRPALLAALSDASAVLIRSATQIDAEALAAAPALKVVARAGVGLDNVDIKAATEAGVMVVNAPTSNIISAAELTIGHILSLARHIPAAHASLAAGEWKRSKFTGTELYEKTVGIIGLGRIGALITARLQAFGVEVVAYDPYVTAARAQQIGARLVPLDELRATPPRSEVRQLKEGTRRRIFFYRWRDKEIWGFTGNVIRNLFDVIDGRHDEDPFTA